MDTGEASHSLFLVLYLWSAKMMGNLNLNENLKSGCSWSGQELPMGTSVLRKSQGQSHSLFREPFEIYLE